VSSTVAAARANLKGLLDTAAAAASGTGLEGFQVSWGDPQAFEDQKVVTLDGWTQTEEWAGIGGQKRAETYDLRLRLKVHDPAGTAESVDQQVTAAVDAVRALLASNVVLAGAGTWAHLSGHETDDERSGPAEGGGFVVFARLTVNCHAPRIT